MNLDSQYPPFIPDTLVNTEAREDSLARAKIGPSALRVNGSCQFCIQRICKTGESKCGREHWCIITDTQQCRKVPLPQNLQVENEMTAMKLESNGKITPAVIQSKIGIPLSFIVN